MKVLMVKIQVMPERREAFLKAMLDDARGSVQNEPGCLRFDVSQDESDPNRLYLYEVYRDDKALEAHRNAPHYLKWRETVKDWYAAPVEALRGSTVFPDEAAWTKQKT